MESDSLVNGAATALSVDITSAANYVEETVNEITLNEGDYAFGVYSNRSYRFCRKAFIHFDIETEDNSGMPPLGVKTVILLTKYLVLGFYVILQQRVLSKV